MKAVRVGQFTPSVVVAVAEAIGSFTSRGLTVESVAVPSSPAQFRSLAAKELDVVLTSPDNVVAYRFVPDNPLRTLLPVQILAAVDRGQNLGLYSTEPWEELSRAGRRRRLGVDVANSGFAFAAYELLTQMGTSQDQCDVIALGSTPRRLTALVAGECDLTMLNAGNELLARRAGAQLLGEVTDFGPYLGTVVARMVPDDRETEESTSLFASAMVEAATDLAEGKHVHLAEKGAEQLLGLTSAEARAFVVALTTSEGGVVSGGIVDAEAMARIVSLRQRAQPRPELSRVMDNVDEFCLSGGLM